MFNLDPNKYGLPKHVEPFLKSLESGKYAQDAAYGKIYYRKSSSSAQDSYNRSASALADDGITRSSYEAAWEKGLKESAVDNSLIYGDSSQMRLEKFYEDYDPSSNEGKLISAEVSINPPRGWSSNINHHKGIVTAIKANDMVEVTSVDGSSIDVPRKWVQIISGGHGKSRKPVRATLKSGRDIMAWTNRGDADAIVYEDDQVLEFAPQDPDLRVVDKMEDPYYEDKERNLNAFKKDVVAEKEDVTDISEVVVTRKTETGPNQQPQYEDEDDKSTVTFGDKVDADDPNVDVKKLVKAFKYTKAVCEKIEETIANTENIEEKIELYTKLTAEAKKLARYKKSLTKIANKN